MFNIGWGELLIILLAGVILLRPEDLPKMMRKLGRLVGQIKEYRGALSREMKRMEDLPDDPSGENGGDRT